MKELNKTKRLTIAVVAIGIVFVFGLLTLQKPEVEYKIAPTALLHQVCNADLKINPIEMREIIKQNESKMVLIDVRNPIAFDRSHIEKAINIPLRELLDKPSITLIRKLKDNGQSVIIYGETAQQANGAWMMLQQTGFQEIKMFEGDFNQINPQAEPINQFSAETSVIDTAELRKLTSSAPISEEIKTTTVKKAVIPARAPVSKGGGC